MKKFLFLGCLVIMAGCIGKKQPIRIGLAVPLTGPIAGYGEMVKGGVDIMVEEINAKGGINGRKV